MKIQIQYYKSPVGELLIGVFQNQLCICDWKYRKMRPAVDKRIQKGLNAEYVEASNPIIDQTIQQLEEYFQEKRTHFNLKLNPKGTDFQMELTAN